jgi:hypothetical protein
MNEQRNAGPDDFILVTARARIAERLPDGSVIAWIESKDAPDDFFDRSRPVRLFPDQHKPQREPT